MRIISLFAFMLLIATPAIGADTLESSSLEMLEEMLGLNSIPADHIIVVDLSGSMKWEPIPGSRRTASIGSQRYDFVLDALPNLLDAIPQGHYIHVIGFHDYPVGEDNPELMRAYWGGSETDVNSLMIDIRDNLQIGDDTDIGQALLAVSRIATRVGHNRLQYVYMFTDGEHDPPVGSPYTADSDAWDELAAVWGGLFNSTGSSDREVLKIILFGMFDVEEAGVLGDVFSIEDGELKFLSFSDPGTLEAAFIQAISNIRHEMVRASIETELRCGGWTVSFSLPEQIQPPCTLHVTAESCFDHLETSGFLSMQYTGAEGLTCALLSDALHLGPGESESVAICLEYEPPSSGFLTFVSSVESDAELFIEVSNTQLEPSSVLDAAGFGNLGSFTVDDYSTEFTFSFTEGTLPKWILILPVLLLLLAGYLIFRFYPRKISGRIRWMAVPDGSACPRDANFSGRGSLRIDSSEGSAVSNCILPSSFISLHSRPEGLLDRRIDLSVSVNSIQMNGKRVVKGTDATLRRTCRIKHGETEIKLDNVRT